MYSLRTIILVAYNRPAYLKALLASLRNNDLTDYVLFIGAEPEDELVKELYRWWWFPYKITTGGYLTDQQGDGFYDKSQFEGVNDWEFESLFGWEGTPFRAGNFPSDYRLSSREKMRRLRYTVVKSWFVSIFSFLFSFIGVFLIFGLAGSQSIPEKYGIVWNVFLVGVSTIAGILSARAAVKLMRAAERS